MLTVSTFLHLPPGLFFAFVLLNGIAQASAGSYLQTAVVAVASLFGHTAMQSVMTGQAAVGVVVSGVQVLSAAASMSSAGAGQTVASSSEPEEQSAFIFFGLSTLFLVVAIGVQTWFVSLSDYNTVVRQASSEGHVAKTDAKGFMWRMTKTNAEFNFAVGYVFVITLVCLATKCDTCREI